MKKIISLICAFAFMIFQVFSVNAAGNDNSGVITIDGAVCGKTYSVYQILKLDSYDSTTGGYIYKVDTTSPWNTFVNSSAIKGVYLNVDAENFVTWVEGANVDDFAKLAIEYAKDQSKGVSATASKQAPACDQNNSEVEVEFTGLNLGYYLVDSSLGVLCGLNTTKPSVTVEEKNSEASVVKKIVENNRELESNSAFIGDTIDFQTTITVGKGAENYKLYDEMGNGLTYNYDVKVYLNGDELTKGTDYTVDEETDHSFEISFITTLAQNEEIVVTYSADLNENAVIGSTGNINETWLEYGDSEETTCDTTTTYTYSFELVKTDSNGKVITIKRDDSGNIISGSAAEFRLYGGANGNEEIFVIYDEVDGVYRVSSTANSGDIIYADIAIIEGLESGTYYLEEVKNPDGYTKLLTREGFTIENANLDAEVNGDTYVSGGVQIENVTGNSLPSTGGIGTTIFITVGSIMVILFGALLVAKLRMSKMEK